MEESQPWPQASLKIDDPTIHIIAEYDTWTHNLILSWWQGESQSKCVRFHTNSGIFSGSQQCFERCQIWHTIDIPMFMLAIVLCPVYQFDSTNIQEFQRHQRSIKHRDATCVVLQWALTQEPQSFGLDAPRRPIGEASGTASARM